MRFSFFGRTSISTRNNFVATGYYNPHTLIAIRILSFHGAFELSEQMEKTLELRLRLAGSV